MRVLSITHEPAPTGGGGLFESTAAELGHEVTVQLTPDGHIAGSPTDWDAIMVFGGAMHPDQDGEHPWIPEETAFLRAAVDAEVPLLGVCLGSQLIARAVGAWVGPGTSAEVGWHEVALTDEGRGDPVLGSVFPERFPAFQWHYYTWELPESATLLAQSPAARQAYRLGERTWAVQFHPEVNRVMLDFWFSWGPDELPKPLPEMRAETDERLPRWNEQGRALCAAFLAEASR